MTAKITIIGRKTIVEECNVIKEIRKNSTREKEVVQALEKQDEKKMEWFTWKEESMFQTTRGLERKF